MEPCGYSRYTGSPHLAVDLAMRSGAYITWRILTMKRTKELFSLSSLMLVSACSGVPVPNPEEGGSSDSGSDTGAVSDSGSADSSSDSNDSTVEAEGDSGMCNPALDPSVEACLVTEAYGVFVSSTGNDTSG